MAGNLGFRSSGRCSATASAGSGAATVSPLKLCVRKGVTVGATHAAIQSTDRSVPSKSCATTTTKSRSSSSSSSENSTNQIMGRIVCKWAGSDSSSKTKQHPTTATPAAAEMDRERQRQRQRQSYIIKFSPDGSSFLSLRRFSHRVGDRFRDMFVPTH